MTYRPHPRAEPQLTTVLTITPNWAPIAETMRKFNAALAAMRRTP